MWVKKHQLNSHRLNLHPFDRGIIVVLSVLIMLVLTMFDIYIERTQKSQLELIQMVMQQTSENLEQQFATYINEKIKVLETLATYPEIYEMDEERQEQFLINRSKNLGLQELFIVNSDGVGFYINEGVHREQKEEIFFSDIMRNDIFVTEPFYTAEGGTLITGCVSIYNEKNEKVGVLCGAADLENSQQLIEQNAMVLNGACFMVNEEGVCVTSADSIDIVKGMSLGDLSGMELSLLEKTFLEKENQVGMITLNGIEHQAYLTYLSRYNWVLVQCVPTAEIVVRYEFMNELHGVLIVLIVALMLCIGRIIYCWKESDKNIYTDTLTKCNSRAACARMLQHLEHCKNSEITIMYMDLNKFKYVNDTYGHEKGDELLCIFSDALMKVFGTVGFVGRMGGDEFISIMVDVNEKKIMELWAVLEGELLEQSKQLGIPYVITSSYGYAVRGKNEDISLELLMQKADEKMYEYKVARAKEIK